MANDGTGIGWSETSPTNAEYISLGAQEIRDLRKAVRLRFMKEHETPGAATAGGRHRPGAARAYYQSTAPTLDPNSSALSASDVGRLWVNSSTGLVSYWDGTAWKKADLVIGLPNVALNNETVYQAASDGFVVAYFKGTSPQINGYVGATSNPTTLVAGNASFGGNTSCTVTFPVRNGEYWKILCYTGEDLTAPTRYAFYPVGA